MRICVRHGAIVANLACLVLAACDGGAPGRSASIAESTAAITTASGASAGDPIRATSVVRHVVNGEVLSEAPGPALAFGPRAVTDRAGQWTTYAATASGDSATIAGVPSGPYALEVTKATSYFSGVTAPQIFPDADRCLDFDETILGRPDVVIPAAGTTLALEVDGMNPFDPNGDLQLISPGAGVGYSSLPSLAAPAFPAGATKVSASIDYTSLASELGGGPLAPGAGLIDAKKGDVAYVSELSAEGADGVAGALATGAWGLDRATEVTDLVVASGAGTPLKTTLKPVAQTPFTPTIHPAAYEAVAAEVNPTSTLAGYWGHVDVVPLGANEQYWGGYADLLIHVEGAVTRDTPLSLTYGDPYPSNWPVIANFWALYETSWSIPANDGTAPVTYAQFNTVGGVDSLEGLLSHGLAPQVGPVRSPTIDGADLSSTLNGGLTNAPHIAWDPPAVGSPTYYYVQIAQLSASAGNTAWADTLELATERTSVDLPPGTLTAGDHYIVQITAFLAPGADLARRPFQSPFFPGYNADVVSGLITP